MRYIQSFCLLAFIGGFFFISSVEGKEATCSKSPSIKPLVWGSPQAKIVVEEYSAPTCHICGIFSHFILPKLEKKYIETGLVRLEVYCLPYNKTDLKLAALIYQMPNPKKFYLFLLQNQELWLDKENPLKEVAQLARKFKMTPKAIDKALNNPRIEGDVVCQRMMCEQKGPITALPIFKIARVNIEGLLPWEDFDAILQKAQAHLNKEGSLINFQVKQGREKHDKK